MDLKFSSVRRCGWGGGWGGEGDMTNGVSPGKASVARQSWDAHNRNAQPRTYTRFENHILSMLAHTSILHQHPHAAPPPSAALHTTLPPPPSGRFTLIEDVPDENTGRTARKPRAASPWLVWHSFMDACVGRMTGGWRETENEGMGKVVQSHGPFKVMLAGQSCAVLNNTALRHGQKRVHPSHSRD